MTGNGGLDKIEAMDEDKYAKLFAAVMGASLFAAIVCAAIMLIV